MKKKKKNLFRNCSGVDVEGNKPVAAIRINSNSVDDYKHLILIKDLIEQSKFLNRVKDNLKITVISPPSLDVINIP